MAKLPQECGTVLTAGGFEPVPVNAGTMPPPVLKALASKESGPPPSKLDAAALAALIASTRAEVPLPDLESPPLRFLIRVTSSDESRFGLIRLARPSVSVL